VYTGYVHGRVRVVYTAMFTAMNMAVQTAVNTTVYTTVYICTRSVCGACMLNNNN